MSEERLEIPLKEYQEIYKEKWSGIILKEVCDACGSENMIIYESGEPSELYPLAKCVDCENEMYHNHICRICGKLGEDGLVCLKCSKNYSINEINELIKERNEKINKNK